MDLRTSFYRVLGMEAGFVLVCVCVHLPLGVCVLVFVGRVPRFHSLDFVSFPPFLPFLDRIKFLSLLSGDVQKYIPIRFSFDSLLNRVRLSLLCPSLRCFLVPRFLFPRFLFPRCGR